MTVVCPCKPRMESSNRITVLCSTNCSAFSIIRRLEHDATAAHRRLTQRPPLTERQHLCHSSGLSSMSKTMRCVSGLLRISSQHSAIAFTCLWRRDNQPLCPFPTGADRSMILALSLQYCHYPLEGLKVHPGRSCQGSRTLFLLSDGSAKLILSTFSSANSARLWAALFFRR